ncbi:N-methyl-L-tryptophan oxidase [Serratia marcescens]|uniref:N-methyl-L-tryptophan oxidase n=1 Tax=Serratia marcescens TaxID=615 RepID=A0A380A4D2_SERMA|nr:N-methyl-L-tryptophan oxidase [Serratia marcescens]
MRKPSAPNRSLNAGRNSAAPEGYVGVFEPDAGFLRSELAVASLIKLAKEAGCSQLFNCPVSAVNPIGWRR